MSKDWGKERDKIIGLGEDSFRKSYYPELQSKLKELQVSYENLDNIINTTSDAIMIHDYNGKIIFLNKSAKKLIHIDDENKDNFTLKDLTSPKRNFENLIPLWQKVIKGETVTFEWTGIEADTGKDKEVQISLNPGKWFGQNVIVAVIRDFTERYEYEQQLKAAKEKAEESDRLKSAFLSNLSHEIRTPMNAILGFSKLLERPNFNKKHKEKYLNIIQESGHRLLDTMTSIIEISKIDSNQVEVIHNEFDIRLKLSTYFHKYKSFASDKELDFVFCDDESLGDITLNTDEFLVDAIMDKLIKNAFKYTLNGFVKYGAKTRKDLNPAVLEIFVEDSGIGIPQDRQAAIFERFVQADIEDKKAFEGSGLGLSICKKYVELLGGKIGVKSKLSEGTTFYFYLPIE